MTTTTDTDILEWVKTVVDAAEDKLGQDTNAYMVGDILGITDWFVVTSGNNSRQVRAISDGIEEVLAESGGPKPIRIEGRDSMTWVLMDYGSFVVHIFDAENRSTTTLTDSGETCQCFSATNRPR